jgi:beta-lactamase regulating signal transducer with metallopeptidase domain
MTTLSRALSPDVTHSLGWALLQFVWQGAALAALLSILFAFCRRASFRYALAVGTLASMVAAPGITFLLSLSAARPEAEWIGTTPSAVTTTFSPIVRAVAPTALSVQQHVFPPDLLLRIVELWFAGVVLFSLRAAGGLCLVESLKRRDASPLSSELLSKCLELQQRMGIERAIRFCQSRLAAAPAVIGWARPAVLLPIIALTGLSDQQLEAVIAHELAHIRRLDSFVNLFQVVAETLLFYHPAVWWVNRKIRAERENCCDDAAIQACSNPAEYARALTLMEEWRSAPVLAMAANRSSLAARVLRLLGGRTIAGGIRSAGFVAGFLCLLEALVAGSTLRGMIRTPYRSSRSLNQFPAPGHSTAIPMRSRLISKLTEANAASSAMIAQARSGEPNRDAQGEGTGTGAKTGKEGFIEQMQAAGFKDLTVDQLIALKIQGVTPEYVREMRGLGVSLNSDILIAMRVQGVTPDYIRTMRAAGITTSVAQLVEMKVQGITPEYVRLIHDLGLRPDVGTLTGMRVQGVSPEYIREMRATGLKPSVEQLIGMRVQGVTPEYVREIHDLGLHPDAEALVGMRVQGITPEYIRDMRATGLKLTAEELVAMRVQGVTPDYVKGLQGAGLRNLSSDDYVAAKVQGITPEFVENARQHGFRNLSLDKLLQLKHAGLF